MLIYSHDRERMGKAAGDIVQERVADVEAGAVAYACGATADRDRDSASLCFCHGRWHGFVPGYRVLSKRRTLTGR